MLAGSDFTGGADTSPDHSPARGMSRAVGDSLVTLDDRPIVAGNMFAALDADELADSVLHCEATGDEASLRELQAEIRRRGWRFEQFEFRAAYFKRERERRAIAARRGNR